MCLIAGASRERKRDRERDAYTRSIGACVLLRELDIGKDARLASGFRKEEIKMS